MPLMGLTMREITSWCSDIRQYVSKNILAERLQGEPNLLQGLLDRVQMDKHRQVIHRFTFDHMTRILLMFELKLIKN